MPDESKTVGKPDRLPPIGAVEVGAIRDGVKASWEDQFTEFCKNLLIDSKEQGVIPLIPNGCQRHFIKEIGEGLARGVRHFVILKGRQEGISTICLALDLFWTFKYGGTQAGVITDTDSNKEMFRETLNRYYDSLPRSMKSPMKLHNRNLLSFRNRSVCQYMVAGIRAGGNLGRAKALNYLHATECSSWADEEGLASLQSSLAEKSPNRLYVFESTARGFDMFYDMCQTAKRAISQKFIFIAWWQKEDYSFDEADQEYKVYWQAHPHLSKKEAESVRKVKQFYGVDITPGQIAWYRWHLNEKKNADEMWMRQEYPFDEDEAFVVAGSQFFTSERLTNTYLSSRNIKYDAYRYVTGTEFQFTQIKRTNALNCDLKVWEEPTPESIYVMGADPAYGSSEWADRFALVLFRCYADRLVQVAEYCSADITTYQFAWIIAHLGGAYRNVYLNLEVTGPGGAVVTELINLQRTAGMIPSGQGSWTLLDVMGCIRHYMWLRPDMAQSGGMSRAVHWRATKENKAYMLNAFRDSFEVGRMEVKSTELVEEMRQVTNNQGVIGAEGRAKDDRVIAGGLAHWVWAQNLKTGLMANKLTYENVQRRQNSLTPNMNTVQSAVANFLKRSHIA